MLNQIDFILHTPKGMKMLAGYQMESILIMKVNHERWKKRKVARKKTLNKKKMKEKNKNMKIVAK